MIALIGHSGSGKDTIQEIFAKNGYEKIVSYTTRPPRHYEKDGKDYHFISNDTFSQLCKEGFFAETTEYRGWHYGISKKDCFLDSGNKVAVVEPNGLMQLRENIFDIIVIYIKSTEEVRLKRLLNRGDDLQEIDRRVKADRMLFAPIEQIADYTIPNNGDDYDLLEFLVGIFIKQYLKK